MANFLEYHPQLEYKRKLQAVLRNQESVEIMGDHDDGDADIYPTGVAASPSDNLAKNGYVPSQALKELVDLTPTDTLMAFVDTNQKLGALIDKIIGNLRKDVTINPNIDEYIEARASNDTDITYPFEDFHQGNIEGSTQAEVLPILLDFQEEIQSLAEFVGEYLFPDELGTGLDYLTDQIDRLRAEEEAKIQSMVEEDIDSTLDEDVLKEQNHILDFLYERAVTIGEFSESIDTLISDTPENVYYGSGEKIASIASTQSVLKDEFMRQTLRNFDKHAENTIDANNRMTRLVNKDYKKSLLTATTKLQKDKLASRDALMGLFAVNPQEEDDAMNIFLSEIADGIEETKAACDALVDDLYKITELEHFQNVDYLVSLEKKNTTRHLNTILSKL